MQGGMRLLLVLALRSLRSRPEPDESRLYVVARFENNHTARVQAYTTGVLHGCLGTLPYFGGLMVHLGVEARDERFDTASSSSRAVGTPTFPYPADCFVAFSPLIFAQNHHHDRSLDPERLHCLRLGSSASDVSMSLR